MQVLVSCLLPPLTLTNQQTLGTAVADPHPPPLPAFSHRAPPYPHLPLFSRSPTSLSCDHATGGMREKSRVSAPSVLPELGKTLGFSLGPTCGLSKEAVGSCGGRGEGGVVFLAHCDIGNSITSCMSDRCKQQKAEICGSISLQLPFVLRSNKGDPPPDLTDLTESTCNH